MHAVDIVGNVKPDFVGSLVDDASCGGERIGRSAQRAGEVALGDIRCGGRGRNLSNARINARLIAVGVADGDAQAVLHDGTVSTQGAVKGHR